MPKQSFAHPFCLRSTCFGLTSTIDDVLDFDVEDEWMMKAAVGNDELAIVIRCHTTLESGEREISESMEMELEEKGKACR